MKPEGNLDLPGVYMEGKDPHTKVVEIDDPDSPQDPSLIDSEIALEFPSYL